MGIYGFEANLETRYHHINSHKPREGKAISIECPCRVYGRLHPLIKVVK